MKWKVQIIGDEKYLEDLKNILDILNFDLKIYKNEENYYFEGSIFENINDEKEISDIAKTFLIYIFNLPHFKTEKNIEAPGIKNIIETIVTEEGVKIRTYDLEEGGYSEDLTTKDGKIISTINVHNLSQKQTIEEINIYNPQKMDYSQLKTIEQINSYIQDNKNNEGLINYLSEYLEKLLIFLKNFSRENINVEILEVLSNLETKINTTTWFNLYKIYELIEKVVGGEKELKAKNWVSPAQIKSFISTSNYFYRHSILKVFNKSPTNRKMGLKEAREIISTLLSKYIEEKIKIQNNTP